MSEAYAGPWPPFGDGGWRHWWELLQRMRMAAERGGGRGRFGTGRSGPGPGGFWGGPRGGGGLGPGFHPGPKVRRGDVRASVLALLTEQPHNGYQIIQAIAERSGGVWRPSAGSVYPALQQLEDEGLVRAVEEGGRRLFELTEDGHRHVEANADENAPPPWEAVSDTVGAPAMELRELVTKLAGAAVQVLQAGSAAQVAEARQILTDARRSLYRILAEDGPDDATD
jgi:DNA-binding PadR family transcriptional regulator